MFPLVPPQTPINSAFVFMPWEKSLSQVGCQIAAQAVLLCLFVCFWLDSPQWARASSFTMCIDHTQWRATFGRTLWTRDQHSQRTKRPCPQCDSNPQSQQASGRRPTPQTERPLGPAYFYVAYLMLFWFLICRLDVCGYFGENCTRRTFYEVRPLVTLTVEQLQLLCTAQVGSITAVRRSNTRSYILARAIVKGIRI